jgi:Flp pilus assembly protein TadG
VTAELALALPTLMLVLLVGIYTLAALALSGRCADAARTVAREVARGDDADVARERVGAVLPTGAAVQVTGSAGTVTVAVSAPLPLPAPLRTLLRGRRVVARVTTLDESP